MRSNNGTHQGLMNIVAGVGITQGLDVQVDIEYGKGQIDVLINELYYEVKSNYSQKAFKKSYNQIERAMKNNMCSYGYLVTPDGVFDVFKNKLVGGD